MNQELKLQIQAYLDNEVSSGEARNIAAMLDRDPQSQALYRELRSTKEALCSNEPEVKLPETRDFYFSQIRKRIEAADAAPVLPAARPWWLRLMAPVAGAALVAAMLLSLSQIGSPNQSAKAGLQEIVSDDLETDGFSYQSQKEMITVVWVQSQK